MGFLSNPQIVQDEAKTPVSATTAASPSFGVTTGKFDREGKKLSSRRRKTLMDRYRVVHENAFELSEDSQA